MVVDFNRDHKGQDMPPVIGYLVGRCLIVQEQAEYALRRCSEGGTALTGVVEELGYCSAAEAAAAVARYVEEEVYELFSLDNGEFDFVDGDAQPGIFRPEAGAAGVRLPTGGLVMEAARRIDEWGRIRKALPSGREILVRAGESASAEDGDPVAARLLALADGTRDIDDLVLDSYLSRFEVGTTLCSFLDDGLIRSAELHDLENAVSLLSKSRRPDRTVKVLERMLSLGRDSTEIRARLVESAVQAGDPGRAVIHLAVLADAELEAGRENKAAEIWGRMLEIMPGNTRALQGLAEYWVRKDDSKKGVQFYQELVRAHLALGAAERAVAAARAGLQADRKSAELLNVLAESLAAAGDKAEACEHFEQLGDMLLANHRNRAAADAYRRALQLDQGRKHARSQLTDILAVEAKARRAAGRRLIVGVVVAVLGGLVAMLAGYEYGFVAPRFAGAERTARDKMSEGEAHVGSNRFEDAISCFHDAATALTEVEDLISLHRYEVRASGMRAACEARIGEIRAERERQIMDVAAQSERIRAEADELMARGDLSAARRKLDLLLVAGTEKDRAAAGIKIAEIQKCIDEIRNVLSRVGSFSSEDEEFRSVMGLVRKYPNHPDVRALTVPVSVETDPPGAHVRMGEGAPLTAPCTLRLPVSGVTQLFFESTGYRPSVLSISPAATGAMLETRVLLHSMERVPAWKVRTGAQVEAPIVVAQGMAVFGDRGGTVWAVNAATGAEVWKAQLGQFGQVTAGAAVVDGSAYVATLDGKVHAFDLATGRALWPAYAAGGLIRSAPRVARVKLLNDQRFLFLGCDDGLVYCLGSDDGRLRWKSQKYGAVQGSVVVTGDAVYAASEDEHLYALDLTDGREAWKVKLGGAVRGSPLLTEDGKLILVGADDGVLYAVELQSRSVLWRRRSTADIVAGPVQQGARVFFGSSGGSVCALRMIEKAGEPLWEHRVGGKVTACPLVSPGGTLRGAEARLYVGSWDGIFYALNIGRDGVPVWTFKTGGQIRSGAAWHEGLVLVGSDDGFVYAFDER
jgi:outer membrane protein assembly factor BamB/tetratricopeptide (TPR) repeat protein